ncbi:hypothetical protein DFA_08194 [Cavenderia fasciculata]|uniref:Uncharacterized protein n=1 Tax=Cavenderia fasciculata TaxID=261658 RepID=F4Q5E8_CACFS|nr:uncharacterized protein DFA_08194 [Cavenderia fasciculata]EGG17207.1 hypothetical protein DFA_08194 [Cavenderia fasciculata]|eukprot:XP_004355691.1 hypothetical protein DFA_08194 [Cavenderia fasciculata]
MSNQAGLAALKSADEKVCIVKSVNNKVSNVVWISFKPFLNNSVEWNEGTYGLYASGSQIQGGATISRLSTIPSVSKGHQYPFNDSGFFDQANEVAAKGYSIVNHYEEALTFGLTQTATVNGKLVDSELNATTVLRNQSVDYTPIVTLSVYVSSVQNNGSIISNVSGEALTLTYSSDPEKSVYFDDITNSFVEGIRP